MLKTRQAHFHKVACGQTLQSIACFYAVAERLLIQENGLTCPPTEGEILKIPSQKGNLYTVQEGDSKSLLCGSAENYRQKNGTDIFYLGMQVRI